ncbi:hypothetical protein [Streptomyces lavendulae]|uniref:hypothetical protein n=1 Tax=Streptomyces lavendulae TaxID=1914 RepID=UPI003828D73D
MTRLTYQTAAVGVICVMFISSGCRHESAPAWGYPRLKAALAVMDRLLERPCDGSAPSGCIGKLDGLNAVEKDAFDQVLDNKLLDERYLKMKSTLERDRERRMAMSRKVGTSSNVGLPEFEQAVAAELSDYRLLRAELERVRTFPPDGDGFSPV